MAAATEKLLRHLRPVEAVLGVFIGIRQVCQGVSFCKPKGTLLHEVADASDRGINSTRTAGCPRDPKGDAGSSPVGVAPRELDLAGLLADAPAAPVLELYLPAQQPIPSGGFRQGVGLRPPLAQKLAQI